MKLRRGVRRATPLPARGCRVPFLFFFSARYAPIRAESVRIGHNHRYRRRTGRFRPKFKKQKKQKVRNAPFGWNKNKNKKSCKTHRLDKNPISQSTVLIFCSFYPSLVFVLHATALWPLLSVSPLSHNLTLKSLNSQLTHTLLSVSPQVLSILVFHSSHMLWLLLNVSVICFFYFLYNL